MLHDGHTPRPLQEKAIRQVVAALPTTGAGETVGEDAALQVAAEFALDVGRHWVAVIEPVAPEREPGREVGLHGAIEQRALGPPPAVPCRAARRDLLQHRHAAPLHPVHRDGWSWWRARGGPRDQTEGLTLPVRSSTVAAFEPRPVVTWANSMQSRGPE